MCNLRRPGNIHQERKMGWCPLHSQSWKRYPLNPHIALTTALNEQKTEIRIQFKDIPSGIFKDIPRNELVIRVQPNEAVWMKMNTKLPGLSMRTATTEVSLPKTKH